MAYGGGGAYGGGWFCVMGVAYWVVMWAWLTEGVWFCVMGVAYVDTAYVGGAYGGDVAYDWAWPMWAWLA